MKSLSVIIAFLFITGFASSQTTLTVDSLRSEALGRVKQFSILLPEGYSTASRYPVLYLLHGLSGDHHDWTKKSGIQEYARAYKMVIVMPDGENSWYVNAVNDPHERYEDFIIDELPAYVNRHYAIDTAHQAIAGLSMGGYGSLMLSFRHPGRFLFAGDLSGALIPMSNIIASIHRAPDGYAEKTFMRAFGDEPGKFQDEHDVFLLEQKSTPEKLPYFYIAVGIQDGYRGFLPAHRALTDSLRVHGAAYEYHEVPGMHHWPFWDREIQPLLRRMWSVLGH